VFRRFAGHHLKVWHYFNHLLGAPGYSPYVWFSRDSLLDETNPWLHTPERILRSRDDVDPSIVFLSGMDWHALPESARGRSGLPVINLIQSLQHTFRDDPRSELLASRAIRICVTPELTELLAGTGRVNGPLFTIPAAIDFDDLTAAAPEGEREIDVLVAALKNPRLGQALHDGLSSPRRKVEVLSELVPRREFLSLLRRARVTVFLPEPVEGLYMPALEGMALGTLVVCPDVYSNRSFCVPSVNCFRPAYEEQAIVEAAEEALAFLPSAGEMLSRARQTARERDMREERAAFLEILDDIDQIWAGG
jgi:glycosyltransferase involved in cell wall biosynthesis